MSFVHIGKPSAKRRGHPERSGWLSQTRSRRTPWSELVSPYPNTGVHWESKDRGGSRGKAVAMHPVERRLLTRAASFALVVRVLLATVFSPANAAPLSIAEL